MDTNDIVERSRIVAEKSAKNLASLEQTLLKQSEEFRNIRKELEACGINFSSLDTLPPSILSLKLPKEFEDTARRFRDIMQDISMMENSLLAESSIRKSFNPMNKLKML